MTQQALVATRLSHIKTLEVTPELIIELLKVDGSAHGKTIRYAEDPIPDSAQARRCGINSHGNVVLLIEDESFPVVLEGAEIPRLYTKYEETEE